MADIRTETLNDLERQAESRRAALAQTVDELHNRVSPGAIKADVRRYARGRMQMLEERIRDNPLQALAIGAGIAYPLARIIGRIPAPLLLIGAGLALSRRSREAEHDATAPAPGMTDTLSDAASGLVEKASETIEGVQSMASEKMASLAGALSGGYQSGREAAASAARQIEETYDSTKDSLIGILDRHPMAAGAAAFAVGGLLASSLPVTRQEHRVLGETSDELKRHTQDLAAEGLEQAKAAARQIYRETASGARPIPDQKPGERT